MEYFAFLLIQQPAVRLHQSKLMSSLKKKSPSVSIFLSMSPPFICQYLFINLVRLKYAIIYVLLRLEVHAMRDKLNLKFSKCMNFIFRNSLKQVCSRSQRQKKKKINTVCIMSGLLLNKL